MHKSTWKKFEGRVAGFFGAQRVPGSGSMGRRDLGSDDSTHPRIYLECKSRQRFELITLWKACLPKAKAEGKLLVVVAIHAAAKSEINEARGDFLLIRVEDFDAVAAERKKFLSEKNGRIMTAADCEALARGEQVAGV